MSWVDKTHNPEANVPGQIGQPGCDLIEPDRAVSVHHLPHHSKVIIWPSLLSPLNEPSRSHHTGTQIRGTRQRLTEIGRRRRSVDHTKNVCALVCRVFRGHDVCPIPGPGQKDVEAQLDQGDVAPRNAIVLTRPTAPVRASVRSGKPPKQRNLGVR